MITKLTSEFPEINWERGDENDSDDHMKFYGASGESNDGRKWIGTWEETDGEEVEITHIEEA